MGVPIRALEGTHSMAASKGHPSPALKPMTRKTKHLVNGFYLGLYQNRSWAHKKLGFFLAFKRATSTDRTSWFPVVTSACPWWLSWIHIGSCNGMGPGLWEMTTSVIQQKGPKTPKDNFSPHKGELPTCITVGDNAAPY